MGADIIVVVRDSASDAASRAVARADRPTPQAGGPPPAATSVTFVTPRWARDGGVGAHVIASAAALARERVDVTVLAARIEADARIEGVTLHERSGLFRRDVPVATRLGELPDSPLGVSHLHQIDDPEIVAAMRERGPVVISAHGYTACTSGVYYFRPGHECTRAHGPGCIPNLLLRGCAHARNPTDLPMKYRHATRGLEALRGADMVVSYSSSVDRHLAANGIAHRAIVPYFPTMAAKPAAPDPQLRRVVFAGRIVAPKGVAVLIRAAREVEAEVMICGDGRGLETMRRLARRLGVEERVHFTGWLEPDELAQQLADASVVAVPSVWPEPFGLVGIEGFAAGRPAVASATGGISDWLEDGISGVCVPPGDAAALARALNGLLADTDLRRQMGAAGKRAVEERFSPQRHLVTLLGAYAEARSRWEREGASLA